MSDVDKATEWLPQLTAGASALVKVRDGATRGGAVLSRRECEGLVYLVKTLGDGAKK